MPDFSEMSDSEIEDYIEEQKEEHAAALEEKKDELLEETKKERKKRKKLEDRFDNLESELSEKEKEKARKEENIEELENRLEEEKQQAIQEKDQTIQKLRRELHKVKVESQLTDALLEHEVDGDYMDYVRGHLQSNVELKETDEGYEAIAQRDGKEMPINDFVEEWAEEEGEKFVKAPDHRGGGAGNGKTPPGGGDNDNPLDRANDGFDYGEASQFVQEHGPASNEVQQMIDRAQDPIRIQGVNT